MDFKEDDLYLFEKLKKGDKKSLELLFVKYYQPLCNFAFLYLNERRVSEEIVADVFINIWNKRKVIEIHTNPKAYMYRSTRNAVISHLRKTQPELKPIEDEEKNREDDGFLPDTLLINRELKHRIGQVIDKMPRQAGLVFRLHKVDGMKYREIAEILNISQKTVENHMGKALKFFKDLFQE